jgi:eukaryotic-like serine/threonine-protein kinase
LTDPLPRLVAALADRYRIERELGQGGMATVYLADDLKHDRKVAVKVLRPELAAVIGAERFLAEIKTTAALQHPHILPLFDSGAAGQQGSGAEGFTFLYYVMPYVEGESLRDRLTREKQLPIADAVRIASEVASALDYAHRHNVIHRDIKPENILLHDGRALVADFGIALAASKAGGTRMTETGMSLGTPTYMSPEQAMGEREITARSDVYALGAMTYEMLLGEPPFTGPTAQSIVAKVMTEKPASLTARRDRIPPAVEDAVLTALEKLPADRWSSAAEFAAALGGHGMSGAVGSTTHLATPPRPIARLSILAALAVVAALGAWGWLRPRPAAPVARYEIEVPGLRQVDLAFSGHSFAISPDGSRLAYVASDGTGPAALWIRDRDSNVPRVIPGSTGANAPFFTEDGKWLGYFAGGVVYKIDASGGSPSAVAQTASRTLASGAWLPDGTMLYSDLAFGLRAALTPGGKAMVPVTASSGFGFGVVFPTAVGRNDAVLATNCTNNCAHMSLVAIDLLTGKSRMLADNVARTWYLPKPSLLVMARPDGSVLAVPFDAKAMALRGTPVPVLTGVQVDNGIVPELAVSASGTLAYLPNGGGRDLFTVVRVTRDGLATTVDSAWRGSINSMALSPDGSRLAVSVVAGGRTDVWIKQLDTGPLTRLTFDGTLNYRAAWRPDGRTLSFTSDRTGLSYLYTIRADGSSKPERFMPQDTMEVDEAQWSADGRWLVYRTGVTDNLRDIYARRTDADTATITISASKFDEYAPALSPDGRWVAYVSIESGHEEVYVRPFPNTGDARWQVSTEGGAAPAWSHSGKELFYITADAYLRSVAVVGGQDFRPGAHQDLFSVKGLSCSPFHTCYAVTPDDRGFIMLQPWSGSTRTPGTFLELTLNWTDELITAVGKK